MSFLVRFAACARSLPFIAVAVSAFHPGCGSHDYSPTDAADLHDIRSVAVEQWALGSDLILEGLFIPRTRYVGVSATGVEVTETIAGMAASGIDFRADEILPPEYWVDMDALASRLEELRRFEKRLVVPLPTMEVRIAPDGRMTCVAVKRDAAAYAVPMSVGYAGGQLRMWAVESTTPDGMDLLVRHRIVDPAPGSLVLQFDEFVNELVAWRLVLSTAEPARGVSVCMRREDEDIVIFAARDI